VPVPPLAGALVVNVGDFLHLVAARKWKSPLHRVVAETDEERYSLVFFQYSRYDTPLPPGALQEGPEGPTSQISLLTFQGEQGGLQQGSAIDAKPGVLCFHRPGFQRQGSQPKVGS